MNENNSFVGLDVHKNFIQVAVIPAGTDDLVEWRTANTPSKVKTMIRKVRKVGGGEASLCYEAGPTGYQLARKLNDEQDFSCQVIAPSLIPKKLRKQRSINSRSSFSGRVGCTEKGRKRGRTNTWCGSSGSVSTDTFK